MPLPGEKLANLCLGVRSRFIAAEQFQDEIFAIPGGTVLLILRGPLRLAEPFGPLLGLRGCRLSPQKATSHSYLEALLYQPRQRCGEILVEKAVMQHAFSFGRRNCGNDGVGGCFPYTL